MAIGSIASLVSGYLQSLIPGTGGSSPASTTASTATSTSTPDTNQLSPFAQLLSTLQQLQQSSPAQYQQVTQQISNNLQTGAQSATTAGNTALANQLTQLSTDFRNASTSGQLPNVQDLAQAVGGGHRFHFDGSHLSRLEQSLNAAQAASGTANSQGALAIIDNTLTNAGIAIG